MDECKPAEPECQLERNVVVGFEIEHRQAHCMRTTVQLLTSTVSVVGLARNRGVVIDSRLTMADHGP